MSVDPLEYYTPEEWGKFMVAEAQHETPFLMVNLNVVRKNFLELKRLFPYAKVYFAVKANPAVEVLELLRDLGSSFDIASVYELDRVLSLGVEPERLSYGNTIKKVSEIRYFYERGVRLFATDNIGDLRNIAKEAPGSKVFFRILTEGAETADWPLSRKFGCHPDMVYELIGEAKRLGLIPWGTSFHVGSQQRDIGAWDSAIAKVRYIFDSAEEEGVKLGMINMGGGFPANYICKTNPIGLYASEITRFLQEDFGDDFPEVILEPGRSLVAEAGVLVTEVVMITQKSFHSMDKWLYVDTGKFNGLIETWDEAMRYPIASNRIGDECEDYIIAGPTCDSQDIMYEFYRPPLPRNLKPGDRLFWLTTGAYTGSYCAVEFNGFPPLKTVFIK